jgi:ankyrin repeat protein
MRLTSSIVARKLRSFVHDAVLEDGGKDGREDQRILSEMEAWLACGANPSMRGDDSATPLHLAASLNAVRAATMLLRYGASLTKLDDEGRSPMALAAVHGARDVVNLLAEHHAPFILTKPVAGKHAGDAEESSGTSDGRPPANDVVRIMQLLTAVIVRADRIHLGTMLAAGVPLDAHDHTGATPLHVAAHMGLPHMVRMLLNHGASRTARDMHGNTPFDVAKKFEHEQLYAMLTLDPV